MNENHETRVHLVRVRYYPYKNTNFSFPEVTLGAEIITLACAGLLNIVSIWVAFLGESESRRLYGGCFSMRVTTDENFKSTSTQSSSTVFINQIIRPLFFLESNIFSKPFAAICSRHAIW